MELFDFLSCAVDVEHALISYTNPILPSYNTIIFNLTRSTVKLVDRSNHEAWEHASCALSSSVLLRGWTGPPAERWTWS